MSHLAVPYLVLNYGCEMIFILEQRLSAQKVRPEKSARVLQDICKAVFGPTFVGELVQPQAMHTREQTREIFDKLAHSSTMRLSENSMDKLYDLMTMACKYQMYACRVPRDLAMATLTHLEAVRVSVTETPETKEAIETTIAAINTLAASMSDGQLADGRHALLNHFQGRRVKISLLMSEGLQHKDGTFVRGRVPAPRAGDLQASTLPVGTVQYFDPASGSVARTETIDHVLTPDPATTFDNRLGRNLYTIDKSKAAAAGSSSAPTSPADASSAAGASRASSSVPAPDKAAPLAPLGRRAHAQQSGQGAISALNLIVQSAPKESGAVTIQNLFDEASSSATTAAAGGAAGSTANDVIHIGQVSRDEMQRNNAALMNVAADFDAPSPSRPAPPKGDAEDLLDLMDGM